MTADARRGVLIRLLSAPALHFLVLGAGLFVWNGSGAGRAVPRSVAAVREPIVIDRARVVQLRAEHRRRTGAPPSMEEIAGLIEQEIDQELLYREALRLGLDRGDRAIAWRVIEKMRFIDGDETSGRVDAYRRGMALGLQREDLVVRRILVTRMRLLAKAVVNAEAPSEAALDAYLERNADAYRQPATVRLTHVFLGAGARGEELASDAAAMLARLRASNVSPAAAATLGDVFPSGRVFPNSSRRSLAKVFGDEFTARAFGLEIARWSEPVPSAYGLHLVWISGRTPARMPDLATVRSRVLRGLRAERHEQYLAELIATLRTTHTVRIEDDNEGPRGDS